MKVLHIITSLNTGGAEKLLLDSIPLYESRGIEIDILVLNSQKSPFWLEMENKISGRIKGLTSKSIYNPNLIFKIRPYLKQYDIIHFHLFPTLYWVVLARIISFSKSKLIFTEHSTHTRRRDKWIFKIIDSWIYSQIDVVIAISEGVKNQLAFYLTSNPRIEVIPNGIVLKNFRSPIKSKPQYFNPEDYVVIQISSFNDFKDQKTVIRSLLHLPYNVKLLLVGSGNLLKENMNLVDSLKLNDRVIFLGNRYDIPELLKHSFVVVQSSNWEGFGLTIVEGMAAGKPVIASDIDGIKEIVYGYGLLFEKGDDKMLASLIKELINDEHLYDSISAACLQRSNDYDIGIMVDNYIKLYNLILD